MTKVIYMVELLCCSNLLTSNISVDSIPSVDHQYSIVALVSVKYISCLVCTGNFVTLKFLRSGDAIFLHIILKFSILNVEVSGFTG